MRLSSVLLTATLAACSTDYVAAPLTPVIPTNPLVSILASEPSVYAMTRLGSYDAPPYVINESVCDGLPYRTEVADSIFFHGDGTYRRVYRSYSLVWRTLGVTEPVEMNLRHSFEQTGTIGGEGNVLTLGITQWRQNDSPFEPFVPPSGRKDMAFAITGALFTKGETLGRGCNGERIPVTAEFTRVSQ